MEGENAARNLAIKGNGRPRMGLVVRLDVKNNRSDGRGVNMLLLDETKQECCERSFCVGQ